MMMTELFTISEILSLILKAIVTALAGTLVGAVVIWMKQIYVKDKVNDEALKALAHDSFHRQCRELLPQETITEDDLENLNYLYESYKALGLNGTGEELYRRCLMKEIE